MPKVKGTGSKLGELSQEEREASAGKRGHETKGTGKRSWQPANRLAVLKKEAGFNYKWVALANVRRMIKEGWEVDHSQGKSATFEGKFLEDGTPMDSCMVSSSGDLVVMRTPSENAAARREYFKSRQREKGGHKTDFKQKAAALGIATYEPTE